MATIPPVLAFIHAVHDMIEYDTDATRSARATVEAIEWCSKQLPATENELRIGSTRDDSSDMRGWLEYIRALRILGKEQMAETFRFKGNIYSLSTFVFLVEAYLNVILNSYRWYIPPIIGVTEFECFVLPSDWSFNCPFMMLDTHGVISTLEYMTWAISLPEKTPRTPNWFQDLKLMLELLRCRTHVLSTIRVNLTMIEKRFRTTTATEDEDALYEVSPSFTHEARTYIEYLEMAIARKSWMDSVNIPGPIYENHQNTLNVQLDLRIVGRADKLSLCDEFREYVAKRMILPCDVELFEIKYPFLKNSNPTPMEMLMKKNDRMLPEISEDSEESKKHYPTWFMDFLVTYEIKQNRGSVFAVYDDWGPGRDPPPRESILYDCVGSRWAFVDQSDQIVSFPTYCDLIIWLRLLGCLGLPSLPT